jgi:superfamily II DNA or RNA helicase
VKCVIIVGPTTLKVLPSLDEETYNKIRESLKYRVKGYQYTDQYKMRVWDGYKRVFRSNQTCGSGLYVRLEKMLKSCGYEVEIKFKNNLTIPDYTVGVRGFNLEQYQIDAIKQALTKRMGIIDVPVRGGKTAIASAILFAAKQFPSVVVTIGSDLVRQTTKDICNHTGMNIGYFSESVFVPGDILVTSYDALRAVYFRRHNDDVKVSEDIRDRNEKVHAIIKSAKIVILDECHVAAAEKNADLLAKFASCGMRIGLSGTPKPDKMHLMESEAINGPILSKVWFAELRRTNRIARPVVIMYSLPSNWYNLHLYEFDEIEEANIIRNHFRNLFIAEIVEHLRLQGKSSFVTVQKKAHGEILKDLIDGSVFVCGQVESKTRFKLYNSLQNRKIPCLISTVGKVGLNLPKLDAVINAEGTKSKVANIQRMRSLTACEGKEVGLVIDIIDSGKYLAEHSAKRLRMYQRLNGFEVKVRKIGPDYFGRRTA